MRYEPFTPMAGISLSELKRRLGHEIEELLDDRPSGISRREIASIVQELAAVVVLEEEGPALAALDPDAAVHVAYLKP